MCVRVFVCRKITRHYMIIVVIIIIIIIIRSKLKEVEYLSHREDASWRTKLSSIRTRLTNRTRTSLAILAIEPSRRDDDFQHPRRTFASCTHLLSYVTVIVVLARTRHYKRMKIEITTQCKQGGTIEKLTNLRICSSKLRTTFFLFFFFICKINCEKKSLYEKLKEFLL